MEEQRRAFTVGLHLHRPAFTGSACMAALVGALNRVRSCAAATAMSLTARLCRRADRLRPAGPHVVTAWTAPPCWSEPSALPLVLLSPGAGPSLHPDRFVRDCGASAAPPVTPAWRAHRLPQSAALRIEPGELATLPGTACRPPPEGRWPARFDPAFRSIAQRLPRQRCTSRRLATNPHARPILRLSFSPPSTTGASTPALHPGTDLKHRPGMRRARGPPHSASFHWIAPSENWLRAACLAHQPRASPRPVLLENEAHHLESAPPYGPASGRCPCAILPAPIHSSRSETPGPHPRRPTAFTTPISFQKPPKRLASHPRPPHTPLRLSPLQHSALDGPPSRIPPGARDWLGLDARPAAYAVLPTGSAPGCRHGFGWSTHLHHWRT